MTAQFHEILIFNGEPMGMAFCPPLPLHDPSLVELTREEIDALRKHTLGKGESKREMRDLILGSTACWRRYRGTWESKMDSSS